MKDLLKRLVISGVSGAFIGYLGYLYLSSKVIVAQGFLEFNLLYFVVLATVGIYLFVLFGVHPIYMKISKVSLFVMGFALVMLGDFVLINNSESFIYVSDFAKILGSLLVVLAWTSFFVSAKAKKQKEESKMEIIEV